MANKLKSVEALPSDAAQHLLGADALEADEPGADESGPEDSETAG
jgi:hypothetical protein